MDVGSGVSPMNNLHCDAAFWKRRHITFKFLGRTITRNDQWYWCCMDNSLLKQIPSGCRNLDFKTVWHHFTVVCTLIPNEFVFKLCPWWSSHNGTVCHSIPAIYSDVSETIGSISILNASPSQYQDENSLSSFVRSSSHNLFDTL